MKETILYDSFVFVEVFKNTERAEKILDFLKDKIIFCSAITLFEIYKKYLRERPDIADSVLDELIINCDKIIVPNQDICIRAGELAVKYKNLSMADSIILASAESENLRLFTGDKDFKKEDIKEVNIIHLDDL